jgi:exopolysaccharide biosynthesis polyprenyl glycosylphosphotransferase
LNKRKESIKYALSDFIASALAWTLFYIYRRAYVEPAKFGYKIDIFHFDRNYYTAIVIIPLFWLCVFWIFGSYKNIYKKSRLRELGQTLTLTFLGSIVLFFTLLLNDVVASYDIYRYTFLTLFFLQFSLIYGFRLFLLTNLKDKLKNRIIGFNTLLVGSNQKAAKLYRDLESEKYSQGYKFIGFVTIDEVPDASLTSSLPQLGDYHSLPQLIRKHKIEEVIIALESSEHGKLNTIISLLEDEKVTIKILPDMYDIITGSVRMNYLFGTALIEVMPEMMPPWQKNLKRISDIAISILVLILFSPVYLLIAIATKLSSAGPVFYKQERIGKHGKPFYIYKFRTMYVDAEQQGPQLSSKDDPRITPLGKVLRRYRIDEFPQFWNVLIGDMSLVGPRPERQFFIDKITEVAPQYRHLHKVRPGITSWGQVKFGYAENVEQMVERMKFDILYIENMSLAMDIKILFYTMLIMMQGRGK